MEAYKAFMIVDNIEMSEYEKKATENRERLRKMFLEKFKDEIQADKEYVEKIRKEKEALKETRRLEAAKRRAAKAKMVKEMMHSPRRSRRLSSINNGDGSHGPLYVQIGKKADVNSIDWSTYADEDEENGECYQKKRRHCLTVDELKAEDVTDEYIKGIALNVSMKIYSSDGSTCHQCRQKTLDVKTVCRSGQCIGVRGQFCGVCLRNRYGESAEEALKDPKWSCPPCRGMCNCSICRTREGKRPTGQLFPYAKAKGYNSVSDYLKQSSCEESQD